MTYFKAITGCCCNLGKTTKRSETLIFGKDKNNLILYGIISRSVSLNHSDYFIIVVYQTGIA